MELTEPDEKIIRDYVNSQSNEDDQVQLVQSVGVRRVLSRRHELYDVHCAKTRWWVITDPTNLYVQTDFPDVEQALIFHLGLSVYLAARSQHSLDDEDAEDQVSTSWRRYSQAIDAMNDAEESEDFQAVGVKCRDALIALAKEHAGSDWVGEVDPKPKASDFKGWAEVFAERLTEAGRLRSYVKTLADKTWDITVWLQHNSNSTPVDADLVIAATGQTIGTFAKLIHAQETEDPERCRRCESYRLREQTDVDDESAGFWTYDVCASCGWQSDPVFTSYQDHFKDADVEGYLAGPGLGVSDRLHPPSPDEPSF